MNFASALMGAGFLAASITLAHAVPARAHGPSPVAETLDTLPLLAEIVPDAVQISPHVPNMGAHWARPGTPPEGPFYCVIEGRVVCVEYMFEAAELEAGTQWQGLLPGIVTPGVSHIDVEHLPNGIPQREVPLYQAHLYFAGKPLLAD